MIVQFIEWFLSRPKYERILFVIDFALLLAFLSSLELLLPSGGSGEVIL